MANEQFGVGHHDRGRHRRAGYAGDGGPAAQALLNNPFDLAFDAMAICSSPIRSIIAFAASMAAPTRSPRLPAPANAGFAGDGGEAIYAMLNEPYGVVVDQAGTIYFADRLNRRVRRIEPPGIITTLAGDGSGKFSGDGGPAAQAGLVEPNGLALDATGENLFIADVADHRVRVVDLATGIITTFAGTGEARHDGDGGPAKRAGIFGARAVALAPDGALYILERQGSSLRRVRNGIIETVAGTGARGYAGDGGDARQAVFNAPKEMAVDADGNVFIVDTENHAIRCIDAQSWVVTTIAGTGTAVPAAIAARRATLGSRGRTARPSARTARCISATAKTTVFAGWPAPIDQRATMRGGRGTTRGGGDAVALERARHQPRRRG